MRNQKTEENIQIRVPNYIRVNFPEVQFHSDFGSGVRLTVNQARRQKAVNGGRRGWPDVFIAKPSTRFDWNATPFWHPGEYAPADRHGLFIELKKEKTRLKKRNGEWADEHFEEQNSVLEALRSVGFCAEFAVGYDEAVALIDAYMKEDVSTDSSPF